MTIKASDLPPEVAARLGVRSRSKYRNQPTIIDGIRFHSKKEAEFYGKLKAMRQAGEIAYFLRQVPIDLPGGVRYVCDFLVAEFAQNQDVVRLRYVDVKGMRTAMYKLKKKQVEALYPVTIEEV